MDNLKAFVRGGLTDDSFIDGVSGIVNRVSCDRSFIDENHCISTCPSQLFELALLDCLCRDGH